LQRLRDTGELNDLDIRRARRLASYLAAIHAVKGSDPALYRRHIRDLVGSGEGIMGLIDNYPPDFLLVDAGWLEQVERAIIGWRWRLKAQTQRLAQIHGDFHPFNLLFSADTDFWLLDRSRGGWGEPGDDLSCMASNYLFFSLQRSGVLAAPFEQLWEVFWSTYLEQSGDQAVLTTVAPFFAWRALVLASPLWYNIPDALRRSLFRFIENVLSASVFDPTQVSAYLRG
jgi:aminoglycoside phosphotransferase (APT) family kinase protein